MSIEHQREIGPVVEDQLRRLRTLYRATTWTPELSAEYRGAMTAMGHAEAIEDGVTNTIRDWGSQFPPPIGVLSDAIRTRRRELEAQTREEAERTRHKQLDDSEVAPRWWARMVVGAVIANAKRRGYSEPIAHHLQQYVELAEHTGLMPADEPHSNPNDNSPRVNAAIQAFRQLGEALGDTKPSDRSDLDPFLGPVRKAA